MPKLRRGRMDGVWGMRRFTAIELHAIADELEAEINDSNSENDKKWLLRRTTKIRKLAELKEKSLEHKQSQ